LIQHLTVGEGGDQAWKMCIVAAQGIIASQKKKKKRLRSRILSGGAYSGVLNSGEVTKASHKLVDILLFFLFSFAVQLGSSGVSGQGCTSDTEGAGWHKAQGSITGLSRFHGSGELRCS
jgi:hypothetical protein